jgi:outer membrane murein-binding lipoprotein Lpp
MKQVLSVFVGFVVSASLFLPSTQAAVSEDKIDTIAEQIAAINIHLFQVKQTVLAMKNSQIVCTVVH